MSLRQFKFLLLVVPESRDEASQEAEVEVVSVASINRVSTFFYYSAFDPLLLRLNPYMLNMIT
jgi:hypothetical protein